MSSIALVPPLPSDEADSAEPALPDRPAEPDPLARYGMDDAESDATFDEVTALASQICDARVAVVALFAGERLCLKSLTGAAEAEISTDLPSLLRDLTGDALLAVPDLSEQERHASMSLVAGRTRLRFFAAAPVRTSDGRLLGALCVLDRVARVPRPDQTEALRTLSSQVAAGLEMRRLLLDVRRAAGVALGQREEALRWRKQRYNALVRATAQLVWVMNVNGEIGEELPTWSRYTGQSFEQYRGLGWLSAIHPADRGRAATAIGKALEKHDVYEGELRVRGADGTYKSFWARGAPVFENDGSIREWVGTCADLAPVRRAGEAPSS